MYDLVPVLAKTDHFGGERGRNKERKEKRAMGWGKVIVRVVTWKQNGEEDKKQEEYKQKLKKYLANLM